MTPEGEFCDLGWSGRMLSYVEEERGAGDVERDALESGGYGVFWL